jgi:hypothetical protein
MVSPVAVLSGIYGVMPALDAVLAGLDLQPPGRIVLTGHRRRPAGGTGA